MTIILPVIGQSAWGTPLNTALTQLDTDIATKVSKAGDTMTGSLNLANTLQINIGSSGSTASLAVLRATAASVIVSGRVTGDTVNRSSFTAGGDIEWGSGAATQDVMLGRTAANTLSVTTANLRIATAGRTLHVASGANAKAGTVTANGATAVPVATTAATANSTIVLSYKSGTQAATGTAWVSVLTAATGFSIKSIAGDTAVYNWVILEVI